MLRRDGKNRLKYAGAPFLWKREGERMDYLVLKRLGWGTRDSSLKSILVSDGRHCQLPASLTA